LVSVNRACRRNGICHQQFSARVGATTTGSDVTWCGEASWPIAKKSPSGTSIDGASSSSQYTRRISRRSSSRSVVIQK